MSDNPYAASSTRLASGTPEQDEIVLASRFKRLVARIIDGLIQVVVYLLFIYFIPSLWSRYMAEFSTVPQDANSSTFDLLQPLIFAYDFSLLSVVDFLLAIALIFVIQGYFLAQYGQTIGKMALNVKIVDHESHEKPTLTRLFVVREVGMSVLSIVPILGFIEILWIFGSARRCVHDYWSRTIVVNAT